MAKFFGEIGFAETVETVPGRWEEQIVKRNYFGELIRNTRRLESSGQVNDNVNVENQISILADPYANQNFHSMRYVEFMGAAWKISKVEVQFPRLILTLGGVYNGK
jgi:hypothetical protein